MVKSCCCEVNECLAFVSTSARQSLRNWSNRPSVFRWLTIIDTSCGSPGWRAAIATHSEPTPAEPPKTAEPRMRATEGATTRKFIPHTGNRRRRKSKTSTDLQRHLEDTLRVWSFTAAEYNCKSKIHTTN